MLENINYSDMIIFNLISNEDYRNSFIPILNDAYFKGYHKQIFKVIYNFHLNDMKHFTRNEIFLKMKENQNMDPESTKEIARLFYTLEKSGYDLNKDFLDDETENWIKQKSIEKGVIDCIEIMQTTPENSHEMPEILINALNVSLNDEIGLDYNNTLERRIDFYKKREDKIKFTPNRDDILNKITNGGLSRKTLNIFMAGTGIGKTLTMTSLASDYIRMGYNVLYVTLEIAEERIGSRIDANLLDVSIEELHTTSKDILMNKFSNFTSSGNRGDLFIKEYPTGSINTVHIKGLIKELNMKHEFKPDVIMVDYLNLMNPARNVGKNSNSYINIKTIAEELRGVAVETNTAIISVTQANREGLNGNEVDLDSVSESAGLPHTADFFCGIFQNETQRENNIYMFKTLKNRYSSFVNWKFVMKVDYLKMKVEEVNSDEFEEIENKGLDQITESKKIENAGKDRGSFLPYDSIKKKRSRRH